MAASKRSGSEPGRAGSRPAHDFDASYQGTPPWDIGRPQPAFQHLAAAGMVIGATLDVGCGTGEHALMAAAAGCDAVGVDIAPAAIAIAERKARDRDLHARFVVMNALELDKLDQLFDTVLDSGLFHTFDDADRAPYARSLASAILPGGHYFLLCFSDQEPGDWGPRRVASDEIRATFAEGWRIDSIEPTTLDVTISADGARGWLASMTRT